MSVGECRFFPDTNIIVGIILKEHRYGPQNAFYLQSVQKHALDNTILPSIEKEFHDKLDKVLDLAGDIIAAIAEKLSSEKSIEARLGKPIAISIKDTSLMDKVLSDTYQEMSRRLDERSGFQTTFDLVSSWIMNQWSTQMSDASLALEEFVDSLKHLMSEGREEFEDSYLGLKAKLKHIPCDWKPDEAIKTRVQPWVPDPDDLIHIAYVATYVALRDARGYFVTNDNELTRYASDIIRESGVHVARPALAYAMYLEAS